MHHAWSIPQDRSSIYSLSSGLCHILFSNLYLWVQTDKQTGSPTGLWPSCKWHISLSAALCSAPLHVRVSFVLVLALHSLLSATQCRLALIKPRGPGCFLPGWKGPSPGSLRGSDHRSLEERDTGQQHNNNGHLVVQYEIILCTAYASFENQNSKQLFQAH